MASCISLLSEEQLLCSICLEVFMDPVSIPCGHNYCKPCITKYWDSEDLSQCPLCKKTFDKRPNLSVNTFISELAAPFRKSVPVRAGSSPDPHPAKPDVSCDFCTVKALKSCLVCQTSYCVTHLEPHLRITALRKHTLIDPVKNLEDRMCKKHDRPLELFCRTDQTCVCQFCTETDHKSHDTVPLEQECEERMIQMKKTDGELQQMIQERLEQVQKIKFSVETSSAMVSSIKRSQAELIKVIGEKQKATEERAKCELKGLEKEITELKRRRSKLEKLSHAEDHLPISQSVLSLSTPPEEWSLVINFTGLSVEHLRSEVSKMENTLNTEVEKLLTQVKLTAFKQYAVDVTLDQDTAHPQLVLSADGKQVRHGDTQENLPYNPKRFNRCVYVLGKQGFSAIGQGYSARDMQKHYLTSCKFYYEVQVEGKTSWCLGVARESISRKHGITLSPENGYWTVQLRYRVKYTALADPDTRLSLREWPKKVGVFVDYEEGRVSFYNTDARSHIYTYTGCSFTETLYPFFYPGFKDDDNTAPLIITPVTPSS